MLRRTAYFAGKAAGAVRAAPGISLLTAATIAAALVVLGLYVMALQNLGSLALVWGRNATIAAYITDATPHDQWPTVKTALAHLKGVERAVLITPEHALARFKERGPQAAALVAGVSASILPASVELYLDPGFADLDQVTAVAHAAQKVRGVGSVDYGQQDLARLRALLELLRYGGLAAGLFIALATAFIVSNTIRLNVYARSDEIGIQRLVGATAWFVRTPFLIEGALWGFAGGLVASVLLWLADLTLAPHISLAVQSVIGGLEVHLFSISVGLGMVLAGIVLGVVGSALAVRRFLDDVEAA